MIPPDELNRQIAQIVGYEADFVFDANAALSTLMTLCPSWTLFCDRGEYWIIYPGRPLRTQVHSTIALAACEVIMELAQQQKEG